MSHEGRHHPLCDLRADHHQPTINKRSPTPAVMSHTTSNSTMRTTTSASGQKNSSNANSNKDKGVRSKTQSSQEHKSNAVDGTIPAYQSRTLTLGDAQAMVDNAVAEMNDWLGPRLTAVEERAKFNREVCEWRYTSVPTVDMVARNASIMSAELARYRAERACEDGIHIGHDNKKQADNQNSTGRDVVESEGKGGCDGHVQTSDGAVVTDEAKL